MGEADAFSTHSGFSSFIHSRDPGKSLIFPSTFISYLSLVAHISLHSSLGVCFNLPRTTAEAPLMHRTPKRTAISLPCPPGTSDFLYLSPSHAVSPTRFLRSLSCGLQSLASARSSVSWSDFLFFFSLLPPPFQRSVVKPLLNETCCGSEKKGTTQIIFPEKVNSLSRVSKYSTGVRVSHPTVWLLPLCCGMLLMSHSSRLDWSAHFTVFPSLHPFPC